MHWQTGLLREGKLRIGTVVRLLLPLLGWGGGGRQWARVKPTDRRQLHCRERGHACSGKSELQRKCA